MSARQWDDENSEPNVPAAVVVAAQKAKWDGEDEEDEVKDSWEDFDDEADPTSEGSKGTEVKGEEVQSATVKKKKSLKEKIAEKEEQVRREKEEKMQNSENRTNMTPQQTLEERERHRRLQEEYELDLVRKEFGGGKDAESGGGLESMCPTNREEFETFKKGLIATISKHEKSSHYIQFVDELFRELCLNMESEDVKKLGNTLTVLANEKNKAAKALQVKGKKKLKGKATLVVGRANDYGDYGEYEGGGGGNEYDDFM